MLTSSVEKNFFEFINFSFPFIWMLITHLIVVL